MEANQLSREAHARLQAEYDDLTTRGRIDIARKIEVARELGDLSENGDYHAAKDEQGHMEGRIRQLEYLLENIVTPNAVIPNEYRAVVVEMLDGEISQMSYWGWVV